ncbi:hypothetical protein Adt_31552 [Abeliophyllum distichum]|uniref:Uncharacterized protein n=1 Tax=Abeliophyllum distichum TaxID=126358 RepID=A0ABD1RF64_9LAMI
MKETHLTISSCSKNIVDPELDEFMIEGLWCIVAAWKRAVVNSDSVRKGELLVQRANWCTISARSVIGCEQNQIEAHPLSHRAVVVLKALSKSPSKPGPKLRQLRPNSSKSRARHNGKIATAELNKMAASERSLIRRRPKVNKGRGSDKIGEGDRRK